VACFSRFGSGLGKRQADGSKKAAAARASTLFEGREGWVKDAGILRNIQQPGVQAGIPLAVRRRPNIKQAGVEKLYTSACVQEFD